MPHTGSPPRYGLVLSGGGARGAFQVGVYEVVRADARFGEPFAVSGTSAGAINAALLAAGRTPDQMMAFWYALAADPPVRASDPFFNGALLNLLIASVSELRHPSELPESVEFLLRRAAGHLAPGGSPLALAVEYLLTDRFEALSSALDEIRATSVFETAAFRRRLAEEFGGETVPTGACRLAINTVDGHTGEVVRFVNTRTPFTNGGYEPVDAITIDMVLASASIPLLFPPVPVGDRLLWDGGVLVNTPLAPVVALEADAAVVALMTHARRTAPKPLANFGEAMERTVDTLLDNAYNLDRKLLLERNRLAAGQTTRYREVALYQAIRPPADVELRPGSYLFFRKAFLEAMYEAGKRAARTWLAAGPLLDDL